MQYIKQLKYKVNKNANILKSFNNCKSRIHNSKINNLRTYQCIYRTIRKVSYSLRKQVNLYNIQIPYCTVYMYQNIVAIL